MEPREYQIVRNVQAALLSMTLAGGYHFSVQAAAVKLNADVDVDALVGETALRPFLILEVFPETWEYALHGVVALRLPLRVHWAHEIDEVTDEARMQMFFRGCADIERALAVDVSRGGLANDTRVISRQLHRRPDGDGAEVWAMVDLEIRTRRTYGQPDS